MVRSEQRLQRALDKQEMLAREMSHRVNNLFAMTDGMIRVSARGAVTKDDLVQVLSGRLHALRSAWHSRRKPQNAAAIGKSGLQLRPIAGRRYSAATASAVGITRRSRLFER